MNGTAREWCIIETMMTWRSRAHRPKPHSRFYSITRAMLDNARVPEGVRRGLGRHDVGGFRLAQIATDTPPG